MRKILALSLMAVVLLVFVSAPAFAQCSGDKIKTTETNTAEVKMADAKTASDCAVKCSEPCQGHTGNCSMINMSIKGMTCGGCENSIKTALEKVPGVIEVKSISYKEGTAQVCFNPDKTKLESMTQAVAASGYEVEVVPAVAKTTEQVEVKTATDNAASGCNLPCPAKSTCNKAKTSTTTSTEKAKGSK
ncbi:MAG: cation transporter [Candidatus Zixiibacteriota bacterium]